MEGFQVGNKLVAMPGLSQEDIAKIEEQKAKEDAMLQGVTEETPTNRTHTRTKRSHHSSLYRY